MREVMKSFVIAVCSILVFSACGKNDSGPQGIKIKKSGRYEATIFRQNCAICHGPEAFGKTIDGKVIPSLRFGEPAKRSEEEIYLQIANGKLPMPPFRGVLTESEMRKMAKFIKEDVQGRK
jgi:mono/diheme cytochrome c family protein